MELNNNVHVQRIEEDDRLSNLMNDILISILEKLDIITRAKTCVLSKRWRYLPWLLPELNLDVKDFLCVPRPDPIEAQHMDQAMASLTKAIRSFLVNPQTKCSMTKLSLKLYMTGNRWRDIGSLVNNAIDRGMITKLDLAIADEMEPVDCKDEDMRQKARGVNGLFSECPSLLHCLKKLCMTNVRFAEYDMHHLLFVCCKQLQHLTLEHCDNGYSSVLEINAPDSKLTVLEIDSSHMERLDVLCLPKLERFFYNAWHCRDVPVHFYSVPCLKELHLVSMATIYHPEFCLSKVLHGPANIHTLILDFQGQKLWIQPEIKQLWTTFKKLKRLSLHGIYVDFDLFWTIVLLEAAPSIEIFEIQMYEHPCIMMVEGMIETFGEKRLKPSWKIPRFTCSYKWQLKELHIVGFRPLEQLMSFVRAMMEQAINLKTILLKEYEEPCEDCEAMEIRPPPTGGTFPRDKDEQDAIVKQLRDGGANSFAQIKFNS